MPKKLKRTGSFLATSPTGQQHKVTIYAEFVDGNDSSGSSELAGTTSLRLADGSLVERIEKGSYKVVRMYDELVLKSDDKNAR